MSAYIITFGFMFSTLVWVFILSNRRQLFLKEQHLYLWLALQRLKYIRHCYQTLKYKNNDFKRLHNEIRALQLFITRAIESARTSPITKLLLSNKVKHKPSIAHLERTLAQFERLSKLVTQYEEFILEREFDKEFEM